MKQNDLVARAYDQGAQSYAKNWATPHPWMEEARKKFKDRLTTGASIIDIGCGPGHDFARPIAGLLDEKGQEIEVPYVSWNTEDLQALLHPHFILDWSQVSSPLPGRPQVSSMILKRI